MPTFHANRRRSLRAGRIGLFTAAAVAATALSLAIGASSAMAVGGAGFTTFDATLGGCLDSTNGINCNHYVDKTKVYMSGGPNAAGLSDGTYYFAVLTPGSQNGGFVEGATGNLSDETAGGTLGDAGTGDAQANRTFTVFDHQVSSYGGTHAVGTSPNGRFIIGLAPFDDTDNPGGVYILAICETGATKPSQCKYDAFHITPATPPPPTGLIVTKNADPTFTRDYDWTIAKTVDNTRVEGTYGGDDATFNYGVTVTKGAAQDSEWKVSGTISVLNPNDDDVVGVNVEDTINDPNATCAVTGGSDVTIPGSTTSTFDYTCTYSAAPATNGEKNTPTATWQDQTLSNGPLPGDTATFNVGFTFDTGGTGNPTVSDDCVAVTDANAPAGTFPASTCDTATYTYSHAFPVPHEGCADHPNTASFGTNTTGQTDSASKTVKVCRALVALTATKSANPTFDRKYTWGITKAVNTTRIDKPYGTATFSYTVTVTRSGPTDSGWKVAGTISVANPNDVAVPGVDVTDAIVAGGATCAVTGGTNATVDAFSTATFAYTCTFASAPATNAGTNRATVTWPAKTYADGRTLAAGMATGDAGFEFGTGSTGNPTVSDDCTAVTDPNAPAGTFPSSTCATTTYPYDHTFDVPRSGCTDNPNTATSITNTTATKATASQTVKVCRVAPATGAKTIGFWQNPNGQAIIKGQAATGTCASATWLRTYLPFQDLGATATCAAVATYVTNVIKAATCSSTDKTCNTMLKAQMLATALDVYFSAPALGGNKILAPAPLGGVKIDLTTVCSLMSTTTPTVCTGAYIDVSSAFNGTARTVLEMLGDAAGNSSVGGTTWYAQNKAKQVLAKDGFDAINNAVAFTAP